MSMDVLAIDPGPEQSAWRSDRYIYRTIRPLNRPSTERNKQP